VSAISSIGFHSIPGITKTTFLCHSPYRSSTFHISHSGYISPEAMVSCFSALTMLETLLLDFESPESFPVREHRPPPPPTRTLLPALTRLNFYGISEYLEDLVVRIDTPLLDDLKYPFSTNSSPTLVPNLPSSSIAHQSSRHITKLMWSFTDWAFISHFTREFEKGLGISYEVVDWQVSSLAQVCTSSLSQAFSATVERLYIYDDYACWQGDIRVEKNHWLELLRPFTSVKSLYLSWELCHVSRLLCRSSSGKGWLEHYPPCKLFSWRTSTYRDLSRKPLSRSYPDGSSPVIP
jgi:hypothetical protein